jgi:hypothetical protein
MQQARAAGSSLRCSLASGRRVSALQLAMTPPFWCWRAKTDAAQRQARAARLLVWAPMIGRKAPLVHVDDMPVRHWAGHLLAGAQLPPRLARSGSASGGWKWRHYRIWLDARTPAGISLGLATPAPPHANQPRAGHLPPPPCQAHRDSCRTGTTTTQSAPWPPPSLGWTSS